MNKLQLILENKKKNARTVYHPGSGRAVLHIDDIESNFRWDTLDEFLFENTVESNSPVGAPVPRMLTRSAEAGPVYFGSARAFPDQELRSAGLISPNIEELPALTTVLRYRTACDVCNVPLCAAPCFKKFHEK